MNVSGYKVVIEPAEEGGFTAYVPSLQGCVTEGETRHETITNLREAIKLYLEVARPDFDESSADITKQGRKRACIAEDRRDIKDARKALKEAAKKGTVTFERLKKELGF